jgi:hypothetical protein
MGKEEEKKEKILKTLNLKLPVEELVFPSSFFFEKKKLKKNEKKKTIKMSSNNNIRN